MADSKSQNGILIRTMQPGDAGYVAYMHGKYYAKHYGFTGSFEHYFLKYLAEFVQDPTGGELWVAEADGTIIGSAAIVRVDDNTAQFRWFLLDEEYQGKGIGGRLINASLDFCRENNYKTVFLWTFKGLASARTLYDRAGFVLTKEKLNTEWSDKEIIEQEMTLKL